MCVRKSVLCSVIILAGCADYGWINLQFQGGREDKSDTGAARLRRIESVDQWAQFFAAQVAEQQQRWTEPGCVDVFGPIAFEEEIPLVDALEPDRSAPAPEADQDDAVSGDGQELNAEPPQGGEADSGGNEFTGTNIQEIGVDESDVVKTDGEYFYMLVGSDVRILKAYPAEDLAEMSSLTLDAADYNSSQLYLNGERLVVITQPSYVLYLEDDATDELLVGDVAIAPYRVNDKTVVTFIDVSDRSNPAIEVTWEFDGYYANSRMIDGLLHLVMSHYPAIPYDLNPALLTADNVAQFIPTYTATFADSTQIKGELIDFSDFYRPEDPDGYSITSIVSLDTNSVGEKFSAVAIMADSGIIYSSRDALYLTDPDYDFYCDYREALDIHKFSYTTDGAEYVASGSVEGRLLNQFSLGEYDGYLRVATTTGQPWAWDAATSKNHVYVLGQQGDQLQITGSVQDLAPGEQIYAARFIGDKGFVVTFRQIDPLFTLDLSDPANPMAVGELKVPGFSEYIHVMDEDHLLTLGRAATEEGRTLGLQLSVFDVSDLADPQLMSTQQIGTSGTYSEAEYNHKAFTYYASQNLLAIPVDLYDGSADGFGQYTFSGLQVYETTPQSIELRGQIATSPSEVGYPTYWGWTRGIFIEDQVYAVTEIGINAAAIGAPDEVTASVELEGSPYTEGGGVVVLDGPVAAEPPPIR